jgi:HK97 family phage major capsid protein
MLKELQEKFQAVLAEVKSLAEKETLDAGEVETLNAKIREGEDLKDRIEKSHRVSELDAWAGKSVTSVKIAGTEVKIDPAGEAVIEKTEKGAFVTDDGEMLLDENTFKTISTPEYKSAFRSYIRRGKDGIKSGELKVLQEGADIQGGYLVPEDILARLVGKEPAPSTVASRVSRMNTSRDAIAIPKVIYTTDDLYTSGMRVTWTGEIPASSTTHRVTEPVFGQKRIPIYTAMMSLPITNDMVEDASYPIVSWATEKFGETGELLYENMIINGTGAAQPSGILRNPNGTNCPATVATGVSAALTWDGIHNLVYALPEQYDRNGVVVMNKTNCALALSKLVDGNGRPYWTSGLQDSGLSAERVNRPLMGYPVIFNGFVPNIGASTYPIIFGDLKGYYLVTRVGFSIQVLRELYAETNQILLLGRVRFGGDVVEEERIKIQVASA